MYIDANEKKAIQFNTCSFIHIILFKKSIHKIKDPSLCLIFIYSIIVHIGVQIINIMLLKFSMLLINFPHLLNGFNFEKYCCLSTSKKISQ